ncbi:MAG: DUF1080 domain-containing protein [Mucilaginibacter sp.]
MKVLCNLILPFAILFCGATSIHQNGWVNLLDGNLSKWGKYLSYRHKTDYKGDAPKNIAGELIKPIGYHIDPEKVFTVNMVNGEPVLHISGEVYGCVYTKQQFSNYHLKLQVKWGAKKWVPRISEPKDSGIIYHSQGEAGVDYWRSWMQGQEFQIMEGGCGDYWNIASAQCNIKIVKRAGKKDTLNFSTNGIDTPIGAGCSSGGFVQQEGNYEKADGEWNSIELICFGDKSIHIVNGHVVMALSKSRFLEAGVARPLVKGKLQLQSEAAEVFYKNIMIRNIEKVPAEYVAYF